MKLFVMLLLSVSSFAWAKPVSFDFQNNLFSVPGIGTKVAEIRRARLEYKVSKLYLKVGPDGTVSSTPSKICEGHAEVSVYEGYGSIYVEPAFDCSSTFANQSINLSAVFVMIQDGSMKYSHAFGLTGVRTAAPTFSNQTVGTDATNKYTIFNMLTNNEINCDPLGCKPQYDEQFEIYVKILD